MSKCLERVDSELTVHYQNRSAAVLAGGHSYALVRKTSNVGERFASPRATLIIDGESQRSLPAISTT